MGVNNRQRRAAKQRKRAKLGRGPSTGPGFGPGSRHGHLGPTAPLNLEMLAYGDVVAALDEVRIDTRRAAELARSLLARSETIDYVGRVVDGWLRDLMFAVIAGGWTPSDLDEIVRRRLSARHVPALAGLLNDEMVRHKADRVSPLWRDEVAAVGQSAAVHTRTPLGLELALGLASILGALPEIAKVLPTPGSARYGLAHAATSEDGKQLSRVRALLAKAESTEYAEEAEALSAKAQELISRYALSRLLRLSQEGTDERPVATRRLWIETPYVLAKAHLIEAVASANRCRTVVCEDLGFSTIVGEPSDMDSIELLYTSLLAQATTAMQRCGRQIDRRGISRTRSFRASFLTSYAARIAERLQSATAQAAEESGPAEVLLPALVKHAQRVEDAYHEIFPDVMLKTTPMSNLEGWSAGRAAADLAQLDPHRKVTSAVT